MIIHCHFYAMREQECILCTTTLTPYSISTTSHWHFRDVYPQDLQGQWTLLVLPTTAVRLTWRSFPREICFCICYCWFSLQQTFSWRVVAVDLWPHKKRQKDKSVTAKKSQKTCNVLWRLAVPLSNKWKSQRIPVQNAPLLQLVLGTVQKEGHMDRL